MVGNGILSGTVVSVSGESDSKARLKKNSAAALKRQKKAELRLNRRARSGAQLLAAKS